MFFLRLLFFISLFLIISPNVSLSSKKIKFLVTKYDEVNIRNGPGINHLKLYKVFVKGYPVIILEEFENWFRIKDYKNREGWISSTQLEKKNYAILTSTSAKIFKFPNLKSKVTAIAKKDFVLKVIKCKKNWCNVFDDRKNVSGWTNKKNLWGLENHED